MKNSKKILSLLLVMIFLLGCMQLTELNVFASFREALYTAVAELSDRTGGISLTAEQCDHNYEFYSIKSGNPSCTKSGNLIFKCSKCGATETRNQPLGHFYEYVSNDKFNFTYKCSYCNNEITREAESIITCFEPNINQAPLRNNDNCLLDVVKDGIINAKDFAKLNSTIFPTNLTNKNSNATTKQVYRYICAMYGTKALSAQQESTWMGSEDYEFNYIYNNTGKYPAMRGLDYMNDDFDGVNRRALNWWNRGGLVTICWHTGSDFTGEWNDAMNDTVSDWNKMLTEGTTEYNQMIAGMDKAANALLSLKNQNVTVLWRPFHEFDGGWFWWGKGGAENFKQLWRIMYDRYTNYWGLDNLIWVLGYSHVGTNMAGWNPGSNYYDIIGADTYDNSEFTSLFDKVSAINTAGKPITLHECGKNPVPALFIKYTYCYFMTWHTTYLTNDNDVTALNTLYNHDRVITLDEVDYRNY